MKQENDNLDFFTIDEFVQDIEGKKEKEEETEKEQEVSNQPNVLTPSGNEVNNTASAKPEEQTEKKEEEIVFDRDDGKKSEKQININEILDFYSKIPQGSSNFYGVKKAKDKEGKDYAEVSFKGTNTKLKDYGSKVVATRKPKKFQIEFIVAAAKEKGWKSLKINGDDEFKNSVWLECQKNGIVLKDFEPSPETKRLWESAKREALQQEALKQEEPAKQGADVLVNLLNKGGLSVVEGGSNEKNPEKKGAFFKFADYVDKKAMVHSLKNAAIVGGAVALGRAATNYALNSGLVESASSAAYIAPGVMLTVGAVRGIIDLRSELKEKKNNKILSQLAQLEISNRSNPNDNDQKLIGALREQAKKRGLDKIINEKLEPFLSKGLDESKLPQEFLDRQGELKPWTKFASRISTHAAVLGASALAGPAGGMAVAGGIMLYKSGAIDKAYKMITGKETERAKRKREELEKLSPKEKTDRKRKLFGNTIFGLGTTFAACALGGQLGQQFNIGDGLSEKATQMGESLGIPKTVEGVKETFNDVGDKVSGIFGKGNAEIDSSGIEANTGNLNSTVDNVSSSISNGLTGGASASTEEIAKQMGLSFPEGYLKDPTFSLSGQGFSHATGASASYNMNYDPENVMDYLLMKQHVGLMPSQEAAMDNLIGQGIHHISETQGISIDEATEKVAKFFAQAAKEHSAPSNTANVMDPVAPFNQQGGVENVSSEVSNTTISNNAPEVIQTTDPKEALTNQFGEGYFNKSQGGVYEVNGVKLEGFNPNDPNHVVDLMLKDKATFDEIVKNQQLLNQGRIEPQPTFEDIARETISKEAAVIQKANPALSDQDAMKSAINNRMEVHNNSGSENVTTENATRGITPKANNATDNNTTNDNNVNTSDNKSVEQTVRETTRKTQDRLLDAEKRIRHAERINEQWGISKKGGEALEDARGTAYQGRQAVNGVANANVGLGKTAEGVEMMREGNVLEGAQRTANGIGRMAEGADKVIKVLSGKNGAMDGVEGTANKVNNTLYSLRKILGKTK